MNVLIYDYSISVDLPRCKMLFYLNETIVYVCMILRDEYFLYLAIFEIFSIKKILIGVIIQR